MDETDEKIMRAALKIFAQESYEGATTKAIAKESGFSELTLFRRFGNKKNLFNMVFLQNLEKFKNQIISTNEDMVNTEFENTHEFLKTLIDRYIKIIDENIELIRISIFDTSIEGEPFDEIGFHTAELLKNKIPNDKIEFLTFALTITSTLVFFGNHKYLGRPALDHETFAEILANNFYQCI